MSRDTPATSPSPTESSRPTVPAPDARPVFLTQEQLQARALEVSEHRGNRPVGAREEMEEREEEGFWPLFWRDLLDNNRVFLVSASFHAIVLLVLALLALPAMTNSITLLSTVPFTEDDFDFEEPVVMDLPKLEGVISPDITDRELLEALEPDVDDLAAMEGIDAASVDLIEDSLERTVFNDVLCELGRGTGTANQRGKGKGDRGDGSGLGGTGRGAGGRGGRRAKAGELGATAESEDAVNSALKWLSDHQGADGGWSFLHQTAPLCQGKCGDPGSMEDARMAATALGVLPFLGAGQTHQVGKYKRTVAGGLNYLIANMDISREGGSLRDREGRMYSHGLGTIALCEAYAMNLAPGQRSRQTGYLGDGVSPSEREELRKARLTADEEIMIDNLARRLGPAAQLAINYVVNAQDTAGGGWRYTPRSAGDTSVVGWQLMGLMSGRLAYLTVDPRAFLRANAYLNQVQSDDYGADYGYTGPERGSKATQAIGLLSRMYLGWSREHPGIQEGVVQLGQKGPASGDMYYNYYATQVMHHNGGKPWERWNNVMRDSLIASQSKADHEAGSWHFGGGDHGSSKGGRLYCTALAAMTLEVYYRHMPIYDHDVLAAAGKADVAKEE